MDASAFELEGADFELVLVSKLIDAAAPVIVSAEVWFAVSC